MGVARRVRMGWTEIVGYKSLQFEQRLKFQRYPGFTCRVAALSPSILPSPPSPHADTLHLYGPSLCMYSAYKRASLSVPVNIVICIWWNRVCSCMWSHIWYPNAESGVLTYILCVIAITSIISNCFTETVHLYALLCVKYVLYYVLWMKPCTY